MKVTRRGVADASFSLSGLAFAVGLGTGLNHGDPFVRAAIPAFVMSLPFVLLYTVLSLPEDLREMARSWPRTLVAMGLAALWCYAVGKMADTKGLTGESRMVFFEKAFWIVVPFVLLLTTVHLWLQARRSRKAEATDP